MDSNLYTALTGIAVTAANSAAITAAIRKTKAILETLLGYSLSDQSGATDRIFPYVREDKYKHIDPCTAVHAVTIVKNGVDLDVLTTDEYTVVTNRGLIKHLAIHICTVCSRSVCACSNPLYEYKVNADYAFVDNALPDDLAGVWADMVTYYADPKLGIRSETLGTHSYSKFDKDVIENDPASQAIIRRYAGPRGTLGILPL